MFHILCQMVLMHCLATSIGALPSSQMRKWRLQGTKVLAQDHTSNNNNKKDLPNATLYSSLEDGLSLGFVSQLGLLPCICKSLNFSMAHFLHLPANDAWIPGAVFLWNGCPRWAWNHLSQETQYLITSSGGSEATLHNRALIFLQWNLWTFTPSGIKTINSLTSAEVRF